MRGKRFYNIHPVAGTSFGAVPVSKEILSAVNSLKVNGPTRAFKPEEIYVRAMYCIGEGPTQRYSIHPNREINGKDVRVLDRLAELLPGAPMMEGHRMDRVPWARVFQADVVERDNEKCVKASYYFLAGIEKYDVIAREIDAGIRSEGSISYWFGTFCCSLCHSSFEITEMAGVHERKGRLKCSHQLGQSYEGQVCYWYPEPSSIYQVAELSHVYRGAYPKTATAPNALAEALGEEHIEGFVALNDVIEESAKEEAPAPSPEPSPSTEPEAVSEPQANGDPEPVPTFEPSSPSEPEPAAEPESVPMSEPEAPAEPEPEPTAEPTPGEIESGSNNPPAPPAADAWESPIALQASDIDLPEKPKDLPMLKPGTLVGPVKPAKSGTVNNEFFELESFRDLEGKFHVEPKYDGVWMEAHKDAGGKVRIFSDEGNEHTEKFPQIVSELEKNPGPKSFIIVGEMVKLRGRQRLSHEEVSAYIHAKGPYEDYNFHFKPFDCVMVEGLDLRGMNLHDRREVLDSAIKNSKQVRRTKHEMVDGGQELIKAIQDLSTREGAMIKDTDSTYDAEGAKGLYKWKRQFEVDGKVSKVEKKEGGGFVYTVTVGRGDDAVVIGKTFATSKEAKEGDVIRVSVDKVTEEEGGKFTWFAPKVISVRSDKTEADPISTIKRIARPKGEPETESFSMIDPNTITLSEVVPALLSGEREYSVFLCGGLVEKGSTTHDIDIVVREALSEEDRTALLACLPESYRTRVDLTVDAEGPAGPWLEITHQASSRNARSWKYAGKFVMQRHWWGQKAHYDLRFGAPKTPRMWGWTCFSEPSKVAGGPKTRCQEKTYHDPKWLEKDGPIPVGEIGNPTKNFTAHMKILDTGDYTFIKREPDFLEVMLHGDKWKGRYVWRRIEVKASKATKEITGADEAQPKSEDIWIMWKPKDQKPSTEGGKINKLAMSYDATGSMVYWETDTPEEV